MDEKTRMRKVYLERRLALTPAERLEKSRAIVACLFDLSVWHRAHTVMAYVDFRAEVETRTLLEGALGLGKRVVLPKVQVGGRLACLQVADITTDLAVGRYGIMEPEPTCPGVCPREVDVVVVPGVAFTRSGFRLGYGGGYYDRFLTHDAPEAFSIGLAFAVQMAEHLPVEDHDHPLEMVITEDGFYCSSRSKP